MADRALRHILLRGTERPEKYQSAPGRGKLALPPRNRAKHADLLLSRLGEASKAASARKDNLRAVGVGVAGGVYLEFESDPTHDLSGPSLRR